MSFVLLFLYFFKVKSSLSPLQEHGVQDIYKSRIEPQPILALSPLLVPSRSVSEHPEG